MRASSVGARVNPHAQRTGYLPNLQADSCKDKNTVFWDVSKKGEHRKVAIQFGLGKGWSKSRQYDLADILRGWFRCVLQHAGVSLPLTATLFYRSYWGFQHVYQSTTTVVSIRDGGIVSWSAATELPTGPALHGPNIRFYHPRAYKLVVLDPFLPKAIGFTSICAFS